MSLFCQSKWAYVSQQRFFMGCLSPRSDPIIYGRNISSYLWRGAVRVAKLRVTRHGCHNFRRQTGWVVSKLKKKKEFGTRSLALGRTMPQRLLLVAVAFEKSPNTCKCQRVKFLVGNFLFFGDAHTRSAQWSLWFDVTTRKPVCWAATISNDKERKRGFVRFPAGWTWCGGAQVRQQHSCKKFFFSFTC